MRPSVGTTDGLSLRLRVTDGGRERSAADLAHRPARAHEVDLADPVTRPLRTDRPRDRLRDPVVDIVHVVDVAGTQDGAKVGLVEREETRAELPFGRETHAITVVAERFGHARDHADVADAVAVHVALR